MGWCRAVICFCVGGGCSKRLDRGWGGARGGTCDSEFGRSPCVFPPLPVPHHRKPSRIPFPATLLCALPRARARWCRLRTWIPAAPDGPGGIVGVLLGSLAREGTGSLRPAATHLKGRGKPGQKPAAGGGCSWVRVLDRGGGKGFSVLGQPTWLSLATLPGNLSPKELAWRLKPSATMSALREGWREREG